MAIAVKISDRIVKSAVAANEVISSEANRARNIVLKMEDGVLTKQEIKDVCKEAIQAWEEGRATPMLFKKIWSDSQAGKVS